MKRIVLLVAIVVLLALNIVAMAVVNVESPLLRLLWIALGIGGGIAFADLMEKP